jgi:mannitol/fructose-specific phosphotransferase system IIA component (Ntr-type)/Kef-type K+ transport system membrane component KefB
LTTFLNHFKDWASGDVVLIPGASPLLIVTVLLVIGIVFARLATKIKLPSITGQILAGVLIGRYALHFFEESAYHGLAPITNFVLGLIGLTIGSHLDFGKLHNAGKRIFFITLTDIIVVVPLIYLGMHYLAGVSRTTAMLVACIGGATAPGSVIHIVKEYKAKGILTKTILACVALNNVIIILLYYSCFYFFEGKSHGDEMNLLQMMAQPEIFLFKSLLAGGGTGFILLKIAKWGRKHFSFFSLVLVAVFVSVGISETFHFSGLLSSLILGMIITNYSKYKNELFSAFSDLEAETFAIFFVLAGTHLDFAAMKAAGVSGLIFVAVRMIGKFIAPTAGAYMAGTSQTIKKNIGISLFPLAGLAIGLVLILEHDPAFRGIYLQINTIVLTAVVFYELVGPIFTGLAIKRAGEKGKNRLRLLDFLQEEYIKVDIESDNKWDALDEMCDFLYKTHRSRDVSLEDLKKGVIEREKEISTAIGSNIAIPHAVIEGGPQIQGVIGISKKGLEFESLDGEPTHIVILIATPKEHYELHLKVLATVAKIFGHNPRIKELLIDAKTPERVFEILQHDDVDDLNPFFE